MALIQEIKRLDVVFTWTRGHAGLEGNERADAAARAALAALAATAGHTVAT
jgi:ribonuclease HI